MIPVLASDPLHAVIHTLFSCKECSGSTGEHAEVAEGPQFPPGADDRDDDGASHKGNIHRSDRQGERVPQ